MPTAQGQQVPACYLPGGPLNQFDFLSLGGNEAAGIAQEAVMRGTPGAMAGYQRRPAQTRGPSTMPQGGPFYIQSRPYSRGAEAYSPKFGVLNINPIGAGVVAPYRLPTIAGPGARYQFAAIWFNVQSVPTTIHMSPTMTMDSVDALLATSTVAAMYPTTG
jgi:hypothetical protein